MSGIRSGLALGLALAWSGAALAQDNPGGAEDSRKPRQVELHFRNYDGGGRTEVPPTPAADPSIKVHTRIVEEAKRTPGGIQDFLIQEVAPDASYKLVNEILGNVAQPNTEWPLFLRSIPNEQGLGASFQPADESVRSQLDVPAGQGLVVTSVAPGGPAARIGVAANDIVLTLGDKPLGSADDLAKVLKSIGEEPVSLKLLRAGKPVTIRVKPEHQVTLAPVSTVRSRYLIGVQVTPLEGALRSHLELPDNQGLLVTGVEDGTAAQKAGIRKNDVLLSIGDKPLSGTESLVAEVQESNGKQIALKILRAGKPQTFEVTPLERKETIDVTLTPAGRTVLTVVRPAQVLNRWSGAPRVSGVPPTPASAMTWSLQAQGVPTERQLTELVREVKELRRAVEQLQKSLKENDGATRK